MDRSLARNDLQKGFYFKRESFDIKVRAPEKEESVSSKSYFNWKRVFEERE